MRIGRWVFEGMATAPAQAELLIFRSALDGEYSVELTGSKATTKAWNDIDTKRRLVSIDATVEGNTPDEL